MRVKSCAGLSIAWFLACALTAPAADDAKPKSASAPPDASFATHVAPLLNKYCSKCHGGDKPKGNLALDKFKTEAQFLSNPSVPDRVAQFVRGKEMPPGNRPQPSKEEVAQLLQWIDKNLGGAACKGKSDPGSVTLRRLNRNEYNNTIRDLVGVHFQPADDFPADDVGYGFDNIGDVLSLPPLLMEKYLAAAEKITAEALKNPELKKRIFTTKPDGKTTEDQAAKKIIEMFARQAFRRNVAPAEVDRLATFVPLAKANGDGFDKGIELALEAILTSPHFLFRVERSRRPNNAEIALPISEFELATRLSYYLWSSMPDAELLREARQETLRKNLDAQIKRMLASPKAQGLVENFGGQWLNLRNLKTVQPDPVRFPRFDDQLRSAMQKETELFFAAIVRENRSVLDFLDADFTYVNEPLAKLYGIPGIKGDEFQRVSLTGTVRGGVLTQASVLTITSNPTRTSPVKRGKWILENILGTPPPPPPPEVPELAEEGTALTGSLRQRMEQHRANPNCAVCHQRMDPLGFGFENFDAIGAWRDKDGSFVIDPSGQLPGGESFQGPAELRPVPENSAAGILSLSHRKNVDVRCRPRHSARRPLLDRSDRRGIGQGWQPVPDAGAAGRPKRPISETARAMRSTMKATQLSRRTMLKGLGTALALPLLDAMLPSLCLAGVSDAAKTAPKRLAFLYVPNGVHMQDWTPKKIGADFDLPPTLEVVKDFKNDLQVLSGLTVDKARPNGDGPGDHARAMSAFLTGRQPRKTAGADIRVGVSVDQIAAAHLGKETRFPSLEIGCDRGLNAGNCDSGYSCAYSANLSWKSENMRDGQGGESAPGLRKAVCR